VSEDLTDYILRQYQPRNAYDTSVLGWARTLTEASRPTGRDDAKILLRRMCDLGAWLEGIGYPLTDSTDVLLSDDLIDNYLQGCGFGDGTRQTMRSAFRRVRRATSPERKTVFSGIRTDVNSAVRPASDAEVEAFTRWVSGIDTQHNLHHDGLLLVSLIRGGGCTKVDLDRVDIPSLRDAGAGKVAFDVTGSAGRTITVDRRWAAPLRRMLGHPTDGSLFDRDGAPRRGSACLKNLEGYYYRQQSRLDDKGKRSLPGFINVNTYRAAWLLDRLERGQRLDHLLIEAGLQSAASLDRYLQFLTGSCAPRRAAQ